MKIKTNAELLQFWKSFCESNVTALNGVMEKLPEALRAEFQTLRDALNKQLKELPPLDQVPAAQEANWALATFGEAMVRMQEYASNLIERITSLQKELSSKALALNGLEEKVTKGELVAKDKVKELCDIARNEGAAALRPEIVATRKSALELAGLPVPADEVLALPVDQYQARLAAAKDNLQKLNGKGLKLGGRGDGLVKQTAWLGATEFAGQMSMIEDVIGPNGNKRPDPLLGNGPGAEQSDSVARGITLA